MGDEIQGARGHMCDGTGMYCARIAGHDGNCAPPERPQTTIVGASLLVRHDPDTERWEVILVSRTSKEDVPVAWKASKEDALAWALNYGVRK